MDARAAVNEQLQKLILGAQNAYTRGRFDDQAQFANQALGVDHTSQSAATLFFVAQWHIQEFDFAARFLLEFIGKNGASQASIACGLFAMLQAKWNNVDVVNHAAVFLGSLKEDDIRSRYARDAAASFQIRTREPLSERTSVVAPSIRDTFGPTGRIKSLRPADVSRHWDTALFYILEDINVRPREWYVFDDEHIYLDDTLRSVELLNNPQIMRTVQSPTIIATSPKRALINVAAKTRRIDQPCILLGGGKAFDDWLANLARLRSIEGLYDYRQFLILIDDNQPEAHIQSLRELGIRDEQLVRCADDEVISCRELIVPGLMRIVDVIHPYAVNWLRDKFVEQSRDRSLPQRIFVSHATAPRQRFANEDEIFDALQKLGFTKVTPDALSFNDRCRAFQNADLLVGPYGDCLIGLIFAPQTCAVFELIDERSVPGQRFRENISLQIGQHFETVPTTGRAPNALTDDPHFRVDADRLIRQVVPRLAKST